VTTRRPFAACGLALSREGEKLNRKRTANGLTNIAFDYCAGATDLMLITSAALRPLESVIVTSAPAALSML
jgi:hypothetical protein